MKKGRNIRYGNKERTKERKEKIYQRTDKQVERIEREKKQKGGFENTAGEMKKKGKKTGRKMGSKKKKEDKS